MSQTRFVLSATFFFGYLAVQIAVPGLAWIDRSGENPFKWRMYSGTSTTRVELVRQDGSVEEFEIGLRRGARLRRFGGSIDLPRFVPPHLCRRYPEVSFVIVTESPAPPFRWPCPANLP